MKRLFAIIAVIVLLNGCSGFKEASRSIIVTGFDFTKYAKEGFLFTPDKYTGDFQSMGLVTAVITPAVKSLDIRAEAAKNYIIAFSNGYEFQYELLEPGFIIEKFYQIAVGMGGDAVVNFSVKDTFRPNDKINVPAIEVSGFIIKRVK